jgi:serine O-acetyltransferase
VNKIQRAERDPEIRSGRSGFPDQPGPSVEPAIEPAGGPAIEPDQPGPAIQPAGGPAIQAGPSDWPDGSLARQLREDLATAHGDLLAPGFQAVALHRFGVWVRSRAAPIRPVLTMIYKVGYLVVRNVYGIELPRTVRLGRRVKIAHQSGIVIHPNAWIGDDCVIRQNVSIGAAAGDRARAHDQAPRLGRGVSVGVGAVIIGAVSIGDGAVIGPNVTVLTSVPARSRVLAAPPRTIQMPSAVAAREDELRGRS